MLGFFQYTYVPIIGVWIGIMLAIVEIAIPVTRAKRAKNLEIMVTGLAFASVSFRLTALFITPASPFFFFLLLSSLHLLGLAVFELTNRILELVPNKIWRNIRRVEIVILLLLVSFEIIVFFLSGSSGPESAHEAIISKRPNVFFWILILVSGHTLGFYLISLCVFWRISSRLELPHKGYVIFTLSAVVFGGILLFAGYLTGQHWCSLTACIVFNASVSAVILGQIRFPDMFAFIEDAVHESRYVRTSLDNLNLTQITSRLHELMQREYVYRNPDLRLADLAASLGIHKNQLSRILNEKFAANFNSYINRLRAEESRELLVTTNLKVIEVCFQTGFNSLAAFTNVFKKTYGSSPMNFRKAMPESTSLSDKK